MLNANAAAEAEKHVALHVDKGLLTRVESVARVAAWLKREMGGARVATPRRARTAGSARWRRR